MRLDVQRRKEASWKEIRQENMRLREQKEERLRTAAMGTLAARTRMWRLGDGGGMSSPKRGRDTDWLTTLQTPPKKARGTAAPPPSSSPAGPSAGASEHETKKIPKQLPPKKVKKWKQRKNGTYGWVTSLAKPGISVASKTKISKNISTSKSSANFTRNENESISGEAYVGSAVGGIMDKGGVGGK